jgi:chromosome segregation ATPase
VHERGQDYITQLESELGAARQMHNDLESELRAARQMHNDLESELRAARQAYSRIEELQRAPLVRIALRASRAFAKLGLHRL